MVHSLDAEVAGRAVVDALELVVVALAADRHHPTLPALDLTLRSQLLEVRGAAAHRPPAPFRGP